MMRRSTVGIIIVTLVLLLAPLATGARRSTKVHRFGRLSEGNPPLGQPYTDAFQRGLRDLGSAEGQHLVTEQRPAEGSSEWLHEPSAETIRLQPKVIAAGGPAAIRAAQQATLTLPIVMVGGKDPIQQEFVASLAQTAGNVTRVTAHTQELDGKRLEILQAAKPPISYMTILANPAYPAHTAEMQDLGAACRVLCVTWQLLELRLADALAPPYQSPIMYP